MSEDVDIRQEILQRTLQEVAQEEDASAGNPCVICLEAVTEPSIAVPCGHANFDFLCLVSWLEQRPSCPLCKSDVLSVKYDLEGAEGPRVYKLPPPASKAAPPPTRPEIRRGPRPPRRVQRPRPQEQPDDPLLRRRHVYRHQLYSLRVGSNRLSQYRELVPEQFNRDEELVSRARKWIRRELRVFTFLNPEADEDSRQDRVARPGQQRLENRRANNAEFLLEYIIAILRTVDVKGSAGQAEELLRDFIGRDNARLFLHEMQAWLRSPYNSLEDWDRNVQYEDVSSRTTPTDHAGTGGSDRRSTPVYGTGRHSSRGRVSKPYTPRRPYQGRPRDSGAQARRVQNARDRYIPD
ncbi:hypothetical protein ASPWEDRAFT_52265 [Aspergillus wentii DTO 134E9]|uniref:RING-type E3 ubiquitin transferase n=1 Tax=Aspergillus wentii DTO 134E9 TaxID=1073089 RepID=A0A1L9RG23_ASPWE|nr:uncharacterized protein ASPWEDRAFT_52265 [Aspergillus wentii DTO 134E9]KAI9925648.1 hypothetical protein MW887_006031 [Aspergillus wentii]OJJ33886.1 hypothetical protein ASPWEDRAFT_52265 [Aspergillus wentii DTO 134E9]